MIGKPSLRNRILLSPTLLVVLLFSLLLSSACKKRKAFNEEDVQEAIDSGTFRTEGDLVIEEVNNVVSNRFLMRGKGLANEELLSAGSASVCGALIDSSAINKGIIRINYNSTRCNNRIRSGVVSIGIIDYPVKKWKQKGCVLKVDFIGYTVSGINDGRTMSVDGTLFITNESGSSWYEMRYLNEPSVVHSVSGNDIKLTFDKTSVSSINIKRRYVYSISNGIITCNMEGTGEQDGIEAIESWGINRDGKSYTSQMVFPVSWNTGCGPDFPKQGSIKIVRSDSPFDLKVNYGKDESGNDFSGTGCSPSWMVSWDYKKKTNKRIFALKR